MIKIRKWWKNVEQNTHEIAGHLILVDHCEREEGVNIAKKFESALNDLPHPVGPSSEVSSVE